MPQSQTQAIDAIKNYLDERAANDPQFARNYAKKDKDINKCFKYIVGVASKRAVYGACCMTSDEVFGLAVHYYDEDDIKITPAKLRGSSMAMTDTSKETAKKKKTSRPTTKKSIANTKTSVAKKKVIQLELFDWND